MRGADRRTRNGIFDVHALARQTVEIGCIYVFVARIARGLRPPLIHQNVENIGFFGGILGRECMVEKQEE